jgi:hypothetical protein
MPVSSMNFWISSSSMLLLRLTHVLDAAQGSVTSDARAAQGDSSATVITTASAAQTAFPILFAFIGGSLLFSFPFSGDGLSVAESYRKLNAESAPVSVQKTEQLQNGGKAAIIDTNSLFRKRTAYHEASLFHRTKLFLCYAGIIVVTIVGLSWCTILHPSASWKTSVGIAAGHFVEYQPRHRLRDRPNGRRNPSGSRRPADQGYLLQFDVADFTNSHFAHDLFNLLFTTNPTMIIKSTSSGRRTADPIAGFFDITVQYYRELYPEDWFEACVALEGKKQISGIHRTTRVSGDIAFACHLQGFRPQRTL